MNFINDIDKLQIPEKLIRIRITRSAFSLFACYRFFIFLNAGHVVSGKVSVIHGSCIVLVASFKVN